MSTLRRIIVVTALSAAALLSGCSGDCANVCERWNECIEEPKGGLDACVAECEVKADNDPVYRGHVEACWSCTADKMCSETTSCAVNCLVAIKR